MALPTEGPAEGGTPFAKFAKIGDELVGAYAGAQRRQQRDFKNGDPKWKDDEKTKPFLEEVMWFVAMPGTTAVTGNLEKEDTKPVDVGDIVRYSVAGFKWGQVIEQRKALPEYAGFKAGTVCSGDVYTVRLVGWSATTENPQAAVNAGFTVVEGRIVMRTEEEHERWVVAQVRRNANANAAKDLEITIRRPRPDEKAWEQKADELFLAKPWEGKVPALAGAGDQSSDEPFLDIGVHSDFRNLHLDV